jgi:hypothetical protein
MNASGVRSMRSALHPLDVASRLGAAAMVGACLLLIACHKTEAPAPGQTTTSGEGASTGITPAPSDSQKADAPVMGIGSGAPNPPGEPSSSPGGAGAGSGGAGQMPAQDSHISAPSGGAEADTAKNKK